MTIFCEFDSFFFIMGIFVNVMRWIVWFITERLSLTKRAWDNTMRWVQDSTR